MPCKGCVFDTRGPRWKSKRASHSRGPVINVRVNSRLVRDRKVAGYSRYGSPQENHKVRVWCYQSESERERERDHSPSYFANSNLVSWHKYRPIEKFNIVEEFSFLEWRKIQIDGKENSAGMIGEKKMYM